MVQVYDKDYGEDDIVIHITKINGQLTREERELVRKANSLALLKDKVWKDFKRPDVKRTNLSEMENGEENGKGV